MKICLWRFFLEDLFLEIFPLKFWKFLLKICSLEIFPLEYGFGDFSFEKWRFFLFEDLFVEIFLKDLFWRLNFRNILMKICSWRFFLENLFLEIFPLKFWKFLLKICSLDFFPLEYGFGDFSFEKWRIFLLKMEIFFMITKWRRWRWTRNDEDLLMMIFFF